FFEHNQSVPEDQKKSLKYPTEEFLRLKKEERVDLSLGTLENEAALTELLEEQKQILEYIQDEGKDSHRYEELVKELEINQENITKVKLNQAGITHGGEAQFVLGTFKLKDKWENLLPGLEIDLSNTENGSFGDIERAIKNGLNKLDLGDREKQQLLKDLRQDLLDYGVRQYDKTQAEDVYSGIIPGKSMYQTEA
ncbi:MAG TPA: hypothetical protein DCM40_26310, partial [Maribacter sp.]|nr:hypothetical protein [Maribacter sp.]